MKLAAVGALVLAVSGLAILPGCDKSRDEMRPDMDKVISGERGLQSRDLREMTDKMAPDLLLIKEVVQNPNKIVVVMKPPTNHLETTPTRDLSIYTARLKALLNSAASRDRIAFVMDQASLRALQAQELGNPDVFEEGSRNPPGMDPRQKPQYALTADFYEKYEGKTSYFLCDFHLLDINTGVEVWEKPYEVRTLN